MEVQSMTDGASQALLITAIPQLFVSDIMTSCAFFTAKLGFAVEFVYGEPAFYAQVKRGGAQIALRHVDSDVMDKIAVAMNADVDMLAASISVDDVDTLYREFQAAHVAFHQELRTEAWGARTFMVRDPDSNLLLFAGGAARA
jgi:catechol 2,3-dioxygenase-like lactoylglutathione lyase family enzyme